MSKLLDKIAVLWKFITEDVWRISDWEKISPLRHKSYKVIKVMSLSIRRFEEDNLQIQASALTYNSLLSLVPLLAILLSIANGFGFKNIIEAQLFDYFPGQKIVLEKIFYFVDFYMEQAQGGLFIGLGIVLLLYTVLSLISNIESSFNTIWQVKEGRSYYRKITDYFSVFLLLPIFIVFSSGLSLFVTTTLNTMADIHMFTPVYQFVLNLAPFVFTIIIFTALYIFMPNIRVEFKHAFYAGIFAGIAFQSFQYLYINGQIWVSKYNAIYGSFAMLPLLLLWLQLSWLVCLFGAEIANASQNIRLYEFEADTKNISRRYNDFLILAIASLIIKNFEKEQSPYSANEISINFKIPIRLTNSILFYLIEMNIIHEIKNDYKDNYYLPSVDINKISIAYLFNKIDKLGSENFKVDKDIEFKNEWNILIKSREDMLLSVGDTLLKDM